MHHDKQLAALLAELDQHNAERPLVRATGVQALQRLVPVAQGLTGQSNIVARFLLSLYNGAAYPFALTDLRHLTPTLYQDCLAVLNLDHHPEQEVHTYVHDGDAIWENFKPVWRAWRERYC